MAEVEYGKTIPPEFHEVLFVGKPNRAGEIIDFKHPPTFIQSEKSLAEYKDHFFSTHIPANHLPFIHGNARPFIILRPTALDYKDFVMSSLRDFGLKVSETIVLENFMKLAGCVYDLDEDLDFTWKWRALMHGLHDNDIQDQNTALVFLFDREISTSPTQHTYLLEARSKIRSQIGSTPYLFFHEEELEFGMDLHHLHSPDYELLAVEYNALMHAVNRTSIFQQVT